MIIAKILSAFRFAAEVWRDARALERAAHKRYRVIGQ
jgi:hypothetical protein